MPTTDRRRRRALFCARRWKTKLKPIVVINKIDRENARPHKVLDMVFDLFVELKATDEQLDFPVVYASAKNGFAMRELHENNEDMTPLFEAIVQHVPPPKISTRAIFPNARIQPRLQRLPRTNCAWAHRKRSRRTSAIQSSAFTATAVANGLLSPPSSPTRD